MHNDIFHTLLAPLIVDFDDHRYTLRPSSDTEIHSSLYNSIKKFGILQPPLLKQTKNSYIIISGRKRLETAKLLQLSEIPCSILPADIPLKNTGEYLLAHARTGAELSVIERAVFFTKVVKEFTLTEKIPLLSLLGLKPQAYLITEMSKYLTLEEMTINGLHEGWIHPRTGLKLLHLQNKSDQKTVTQLLKNFQFGGSKQQKLIDNAIELVKRTGQSLETIIKEWRTDCKDKNNKPQQGAALLHLLERKSHLRLAAAQEQFQKFQQNLKLPENVKLNHSKSFEDNTVSLSISFADQEMLFKNWQDIEKVLTRVNTGD